MDEKHGFASNIYRKLLPPSLPPLSLKLTRFINYITVQNIFWRIHIGITGNLRKTLSGDCWAQPHTHTHAISSKFDLIVIHSLWGEREDLIKGKVESIDS